MDFTERTTLVTGAAGGIGAVVARTLATRGAAVAAADSDAAGLDAVVDKLLSDGLRATTFAVDVRDSAAVDDMVDRVEGSLGPIDVLVNCTGVLRCAPIVDLTDEDWTETIAVNTSGPFHVSRAVARRMVPRRAGAIVTVTSNSARVPRAQMGAYAASKAATMMLTKCLGLELSGHGIRDNRAWLRSCRRHGVGLELGADA
ncbi:MAG: SDR family NAD(P)-dependent oxidoreductase [Pseudonocardiaceae bacterium]